MVRHAKVNKSGSLRETLAGGQVTEHPRASAPARTVHIPAMYLRPLGDREIQGCLKSRA
jgi:hypothetical protein